MKLEWAPLLVLLLCLAGCPSSGTASRAGNASAGSVSASNNNSASGSGATSPTSPNPASPGAAGSSPTAATSGSTADVLVDASRTLAGITRDEIGTNVAIWYNATASDLPAEIAALSPGILRWPGGSTADTYHWRSQTKCNAPHKLVSAYDSRSTFDAFMNDIVIPGGYDVAITVDYGSNESCTGGGDPKEAAAWVAYAKSKGYDRYIKYWTVGNEEYGGWELDLHSHPHDPAGYAAAVAGPNGYYALMKAADPSARVGVLIKGDPTAYHGWDRLVLANAPYDFVELHDYLQQPGHESDSYLLHDAPQALSETIATVRRELSAAGKPDTPVMLGEFNSVAYSPGKQTLSIVNALFTGMAFGEVLNDNLSVATWWFGAGGNQLCHDNNSRSLYGWQQFGGYDLIAANASSSWNGCNAGPMVPEGTLLPSGDAFSMMSRFAQAGESMLGVAVSPSLPEVRAYAATLRSGGYAVMLFNLNETASATLTVGVANANLTSYTATTLTYDKALYDESRNNLWPGPVSATLGSVGAAAQLTLPPWSMVLLELQ